MSQDVTRRLSPEEKELEKKRLELAELEGQLVQRELELATLRAELGAFERRYLQTVGVRYAELDKIEAQIAELLAQQSPQDANAWEHATQARTQADESYHATRDAIESKEKTDFKPTNALKRLYRELAKKVHPDLASDELDRARRERFMAEVNRAYERADLGALQALLREWEESPDAIKGEGVAVELVRVIRKMAWIQERLRAIETEIGELKASDRYHLRTEVENAEREGRDLLAERAVEVNQKIAAAQERLARAQKKN